MFYLLTKDVLQKASKYDQEMQQSQTSPCHHEEEKQSTNSDTEDYI